MSREGVGLKRRYQRQEGFTIIELLVASVIFLTVVGSIFSVYASQRKAHDKQQQTTRRDEDIRMAMHYLAKYIRMAGYDPMASAQAGFVSAFPQRARDIGPRAEADYIAFSMDYDANGLVEMEDAGGDPVRHEVVGFKLQDGTLSAFGIVRRTWWPLIDHVDALDFVYLDENRNVIADPDLNRADIRAVQISIVVRSDEEINSSPDRTLYRNLQGQAILPSPHDRYHRQQLSCEIKCRNLGI